MGLGTYGLILDFIGAVVIGWVSHEGVSSGWGGQLGYKSEKWRIDNSAGWALIAVGFIFQIVG